MSCRVRVEVTRPRAAARETRAPSGGFTPRSHLIAPDVGSPASAVRDAGCPHQSAELGVPGRNHRGSVVQPTVHVRSVPVGSRDVKPGSWTSQALVLAAKVLDVSLVIVLPLVRPPQPVPAMISRCVAGPRAGDVYPARLATPVHHRARRRRSAPEHRGHLARAPVYRDHPARPTRRSSPSVSSPPLSELEEQLAALSRRGGGVGAWPRVTDTGG